MSSVFAKVPVYGFPVDNELATRLKMNCFQCMRNVYVYKKMLLVTSTWSGRFMVLWLTVQDSSGSGLKRLRRRTGA